MHPQRIADAPAFRELMNSPDCGQVDLNTLGM
jgi:hypothetical protein